jgi:ElaB/YqjD/DUF883 family membrane-anchored ribosome-binding protein
MSEQAKEQTAPDPEELREEIEQTRAELGDTVDALSQKADVKGQVQDKVDERKAAFKAKAGDARERVSNATPDDAKHAAAQVAHTAEQRPLPAIGIALAAGLLIGWAVGRR